MEKLNIFTYKLEFVCQAMLESTNYNPLHSWNLADKGSALSQSSAAWVQPSNMLVVGRI